MDMVVVPPKPETPDIDRSNPRNLINLLPKYMADLVDRLPEELWSLTDEELELDIFNGNSPNQTVNSLKISFWEEYDKCQRENRKKMDIDAIITRISTITFFRDRFISNPKQLAWLIRPTPLYSMTVKDTLRLAAIRLRELVSAPAVSPVTGRYDTKLAELQLKIYQTLDMRENGAVIQRIDQRQINMNIDAGKAPDNTAKAATKAIEDMDQIQSRLKELEARSRQLENPAQEVKVDLMSDVRIPQVIDVTPNKV